MTDIQELIGLGVLAVLSFFCAFYFFNKIIKIDKVEPSNGEAWKDEDFIKALNLRKYEKDWNQKDPKVIFSLYRNNMLLKLIFEEGVVANVIKTKQEGESDLKDILQIADYFRGNSESNNKVKKNLEEGNVELLLDFNSKTIDYISWFLEKYSDIEVMSKELTKEKELIVKYKGVKGVKQRAGLIKLYLMSLNDVRNKRTEETKSNLGLDIISETNVNEIG